MKILKYNILLACILSVSCGGGGDDSGGPDPDPDPVPAPSATTLVFPDDDEECNEGVVVSATQSTVTFEWNASQNTDSYEVNLRDLNTNNTSRTVSNTTTADITIGRGVPYEWFVVSRASGTNETATSPTWRFYNQGPGVENYAPFPAEAVNPPRGATIDDTATVTLEWEGSDVDDDLTEFDVFFGTDADPATLLETTAESTAEAAISSGQIFYWKVVSKDSQGNSSQSEIFEFRVE